MDDMFEIMSRFEQLDADKKDLLERIDTLRYALKLADQNAKEHKNLIAKQDSIISEFSTSRTKQLFEFNGLQAGIQTTYSIDGSKEFRYYGEFGAGVNIWNLTTRAGLRIPLNKEEKMGLFFGIQYNFFKQ